MRDAYEILQVSPNAEPEVIDAAYRRLARKYHPDVSSRPDAHAHMQEINWAYEILRDPLKRSRYDASMPRRGSGPEEPGREWPGSPFEASPAPPVGPESRPAWRKYWPLSAVVVLAYLLLTRSSLLSSPQDDVLMGSTSAVVRQATQVDPYASCLPWTEADEHDGERVCIIGKIVVVAYQFVVEAGQDMWSAEFSFDPHDGFSLISVGEDISEWEGRCVAVYGRLFDRSLVAEYVAEADNQPSMINSDPYVGRDFTITEAPEQYCR